MAKNSIALGFLIEMGTFLLYVHSALTEQHLKGFALIFNKNILHEERQKREILR